jgi:DnaK suppressor protein
MTNKAIRNADLWRMLSERRRELQEAIHSRINDGRTDRSAERSEGLEDTDAHIHRDIEFALLQMKAETLTRINEAIVRLDAGKYGSCVECEGEISERRLRAMPFAVRCQACEERREGEQGDARHRARQRGSISLFTDAAGF